MDAEQREEMARRCEVRAARLMAAPDPEALMRIVDVAKVLHGLAEDFRKLGTEPGR